jgi:hypothetical protein
MPKYEVSLNHPLYDKDTELDVQDVGRVQNGGSVVVNLTEDQADNIKASDYVKAKKVAQDTPTTWEDQQEEAAKKVAEENPADTSQPDLGPGITGEGGEK